MAVNRGKQFEDKFKECWSTSFPDTLVFRLKDQVSGYKDTSQNPCDFICFPTDKVFMIECKTHKGASIPFSDIPQYSRLLSYKGKKNVRPGVVLWLYEKDIVMWISIEEMEKMVKDGEKSIGIRMLDSDRYNIVIIPSKKLRVLMDSDYRILVEGENK